MHHLDWGLIRPEECLGMSGVTGCGNGSHCLNWRSREFRCTVDISIWDDLDPCRPAMFVVREFIWQSHLFEHGIKVRLDSQQLHDCMLSWQIVFFFFRGPRALTFCLSDAVSAFSRLASCVPSSLHCCPMPCPPPHNSSLSDCLQSRLQEPAEIRGISFPRLI